MSTDIKNKRETGEVDKMPTLSSFDPFYPRNPRSSVSRALLHFDVEALDLLVQR